MVIPVRTVPDGMTPAEYNVLQGLVRVWNDYLALPIEHADDHDEFRRGIHQLQEKIMARPVRRAINISHERQGS